MTRCLRCGEKPVSDAAADLIEKHEMCPECRRQDLADRLRYIRAELRDLERDTEPIASLGLLQDDDLEASIHNLVRASTDDLVDAS